MPLGPISQCLTPRPQRSSVPPPGRFAVQLFIPEFHEDFMRKVGLIGILAGLLIGSFFLTLWLTDSGTSPKTDDRSDAERLASRNISSRPDLIDAAIGAGLQSSTAMKGNVDSMSRVSDGEVAIGGWLADPGGDATPLTLLIFVAGKKAAATQTRDERPDVTKLLGLAFGAEKNVAFKATFPCLAGDQPVIAGLGSDKQYLYVSSPPCP
jgi:hypothetical protein